VIYYSKDIQKLFRKGHLPKEIADIFVNTFKALDLTKDLNIFDVKKLHTENKIDYYRLRKGKYRAIFYIQNNDYFVIAISKREEVYKKWL